MVFLFSRATFFASSEKILVFDPAIPGPETFVIRSHGSFLPLRGAEALGRQIALLDGA